MGLGKITVVDIMYIIRSCWVKEVFPAKKRGGEGAQLKGSRDTRSPILIFAHFEILIKV